MSAKTRVQVSLSPEGQLSLDLPGAAGSLRSIPLRPSSAFEVIFRTLTALQHGPDGIGEDGAPTADLVRHWEMHGIWPDARCVHCQALGRARSAIAKQQQRRELIRKCNGVEVRRLPPARAVLIGKTAEELGL